MDINTTFSLLQKTQDMSASLPSYNFAPNSGAIEPNLQENENTPVDAEREFKQQWFDSMPPIWVLPLREEYIDEICSLLKQEEIHMIRALMDENTDAVAKSDCYLDGLITIYTNYRVKLFLKHMKDMISLYHEAKAFPPI